MNPYGGEHQAVRRANLPYAYGSACSRCGQPMLEGQDLDLDHHDDRQGYRGFSHSLCNRRAGGRLGAARRKALKRARMEGIRRMQASTDVVLGVEISEDRTHTSIVAASGLPDDCTMVDLVAYLDGTDALADVQRLHEGQTVRTVVIDSHSPAATLIKPLTAAGIAVTLPSVADVVVAHGEFLDLATAGKLRHRSQPQLDAAVRHGAQRRLGGAATWERRGISVDVSPLSAATLATWGLRNVVPQPFFGTFR